MRLIVCEEKRPIFVCEEKHRFIAFVGSSSDDRDP